MAQRLKRWESPRRQGRNDKGKGGSARQRQLKKQQQMLRKKLKEGQQAENQDKQGGRDNNSLPLLFGQSSLTRFNRGRFTDILGYPQTTWLNLPLRLRQLYSTRTSIFKSGITYTFR